MEEFIKIKNLEEAVAILSVDFSGFSFDLERWNQYTTSVQDSDLHFAKHRDVAVRNPWQFLYHFLVPKRKKDDIMEMLNKFPL